MVKPRVYVAPECPYVIEGNHIRTDGSIKHKVSGTSMAGILGCSPWSTPFQVACNLLGLGQEDISAKPSVKVGIALEAPIIAYADKVYPETYVPADEAFAKRLGRHEAWTSDFDDECFAGHVDGLVFDEAGEGYILEIKTSGSTEHWLGGVPEYYRLQVSLYNHFLAKKDKAYVVLGVVNENTYRDPLSWVPSQNNTFLFQMPIDMDGFSKDLDTAREWYKEYILNGVTPDYDPTNEGDVSLWKHLNSIADGIDTKQAMLDEYARICSKIDSTELSIQDLYERRDVIKNEIKAYMDAHELSVLDAANTEGVSAKLTVQTREGWDVGKMVQDGVDPDKYRTVKTVKVLKMSV